MYVCDQTLSFICTHNTIGYSYISIVLLPHSFERLPIELPETLRVNLVPGELASYAQARGDFNCCCCYEQIFGLVLDVCLALGLVFSLWSWVIYLVLN